MYQGQLCKIQVHENRDPAFTELVGKEGGWFLKLRDEYGRTRFHLVGEPEGHGMCIDPAMVDESLRNEDATKPFYVICVVPSGLQAAMLTVSPKLEGQVSRLCLDAKIAAADRASEAQHETLKRALEKAKQYTDKAAELDAQAMELRKIAAMAEPYFVYAYGKHNAAGQEFAWRVPFELYDRVLPGSTVVVDTKFGSQPVVVTRVERISHLLAHKMVVSMA